jgi:hypothetical protein
VTATKALSETSLEAAGQGDSVMEEADRLDPTLFGNGNCNIDKILAEALIKSTDEYKKGYEDGLKEAIEVLVKTVRKRADAFFGETVAFAEVFYSILVDIVPSEHIRQYRIGLDYTTETPTVLAVISADWEHVLYDVEQAAAQFDLFIFQRYKRPCSFWVIPDGDLDQDLINRDFPWSKRN